AAARAFGAVPGKAGVPAVASTRGIGVLCVAVCLGADSAVWGPGLISGPPAIARRTLGRCRPGGMTDPAMWGQPPAERPTERGGERDDGGGCGGRWRGGGDSRPRHSEAVSLLRATHGRGTLPGSLVALLLCTCHRWDRVTAKLIAAIDDSGLLSSVELDELA